MNTDAALNDEEEKRGQAS